MTTSPIATDLQVNKQASTRAKRDDSLSVCVVWIVPLVLHTTMVLMRSAFPSLCRAALAWMGGLLKK
jgi:hypothetical protein